MTMAHGEHQLRRTGDPLDAHIADLLATALALRGGRDIPLPDTTLPERFSALDMPVTDGVGVLALASAATKPPVTLREVELHTDRTVILRRRLQETTEPYVTAISSNLVLAELKSSLMNRMGRDGRHRTTQIYKHGQHQFRYKTATRFEFAEDSYNLEQYKLDISYVPYTIPAVSLSLDLAGGDLDALNLTWRGGATLKALMPPGSPLVSLVESYPANDDGLHVLAVYFAKPSIGMRTIRNRYETNDTYDHIYDPAGDVLAQTYVRGRSVSPINFTPDEYLKLVKDTLSLVPTEQLGV